MGGLFLGHLLEAHQEERLGAAGWQLLERAHDGADGLPADDDAFRGNIVDERIDRLELFVRAPAPARLPIAVGEHAGGGAEEIAFDVADITGRASALELYEHLLDQVVGLALGGLSQEVAAPGGTVLRHPYAQVILALRPLGRRRGLYRRGV